MNKRAALLDDSKEFVNIIACGLRLFAGYSTEHFTSIEGFISHIGWKTEDGVASLAEKVKQFGLISCDNNFLPIGNIKGSNFLFYALGPAIKSLPENEKPILVCFAPSSETSLAAFEKRLWEEFGIVSLHKINECTVVPLDAFLAEKYGCVLNREALVKGVLKLELDETIFGTKKGEFHRAVQRKMTQLGDIFNVEGVGNQIPFEQTLKIFANALKIPKEELLGRIEAQVEIARQAKEGGTTRGKER